MTEIKGNSRSSSGIKEVEFWILIKEGDKSGLEGLFSLFAEELMAFGMHIEPDRDLVKDCIQNLFIDIWKYRKSTNKVQNVKSYIFRSLANKIKKEINNTKKRKLNEQLIANDLLYDQECFEDEDAVQLVKGKTNSRLMTALNLLPTRQKEVIIHVFFENLPQSQIAEIMGINVQSVYTLTWKAIGNLRKNITLFLLFLLLR